MHIPPAKLLPMLEAGSTYMLRTADHQGADPAFSYTHAVSACIRGEIEGVATPGGRIRYLRILADEEREPNPVSNEVVAEVFPDRAMEIRSAALVTVYDEHVGDHYVPTLCKVRGGRFYRWSDTDGFNPARFNPDRIPAPLRGAVVAAYSR